MTPIIPLDHRLVAAEDAVADDSRVRLAFADVAFLDRLAADLVVINHNELSPPEGTVDHRASGAFFSINRPTCGGDR